jgi:hypothetical protein
MTLKTTPEEMIKYATKFEIPSKTHIRLRIEKSTYLEGDNWLIKQVNNEVFDRTRGKFGFIHDAKGTPEYYYSSLEEAFDNVNWLIQKEKQDKIDYTA